MPFETDPEFEDRMAMADAIRRASLAKGSPEMVMVPKADYEALRAALGVKEAG